MTPHVKSLSVLSASILVLALLAASVAGPTPRQRMAAAASAFLESLSPELRITAGDPFDAAHRKDWHITPHDGHGVKLGQLDDDQRHALHLLLRSTLSEQGYLKTTGIMHLEDVLREIESTPDRPATHRDPGLYRVSIFGDPAGPDPWGWRLEGHHLSLNFSTVSDAASAATPFFMGANPSEVPNGPDAGWRILGAEQDLARALIASMNDEQRALATIAAEAPRDVIFGPGRDSFPAQPEGVAVAHLGAERIALALELVQTVTQRNLRDDLAAVVAGDIGNGTLLPSLYFAWAGDSAPGRPHYWRIHGPNFIIEYDNTQNDANHAHMVWRDLNNDFGEDALRRHHETHQH